MEKEVLNQEMIDLYCSTLKHFFQGYWWNLRLANFQRYVLQHIPVHVYEFNSFILYKALTLYPSSPKAVPGYVCSDLQQSKSDFQGK